MIKPPNNESEVVIWRENIGRMMDGKYTLLAKHTTAALPTLLSTDRGLAWDTTLNKPVAWNGTSWNALY